MVAHVSDANHDGSVEGLVRAFSMIIVSEIGDKTFLIAAILAMRHPRLTVFAGAFGSLLVMSLLSAAMGHLLPSLIPKQWTQAAAAILFLVFGIKMLNEAKEMKGGNLKMQEEMREAEEEIEEDALRDGHGHIPLQDIEEGSHSPLPKPPKDQSLREATRNFCNFFLGPVFVQSFILTFLGEWGDRSQIATIALAAAHNVWIVAFGTILGHSLCTALAVIAGRYVSTKISIKHVTFGGAILFILFGFIYLYEAYSMTSDLDLPLPLQPDDNM